MNPNPQERSPAINIRIKASQKHLIQAAADLSDHSLSDFVRKSALLAAQELLLDQKTFYLEDKAWKNFIQALDEAPQDNPRFCDLLSRKAPWEK